MRRIVSLLVLSVCSLQPVRAGSVSTELSSGTFSIQCDEAAAQLQVSYSGRPICVYSFASNQFKPYVKELRTLAGENVLLDSPPDHLHHHGLMYAIRVNGINFWEEVEPAGKERHVAITAQNVSAHDASFSELIDWIAPSEPLKPLLIERREITLSVDEAQKEVGLRWKSRFEVGARAVKLTGTAYNGLGLRLPPEWNGTSVHSNSENLPYTPEHKWDVTPGRWASVYHEGRGFKSTLAILGAKNAGETRFFSMNNPFTYLSVTQNLEQHPFVYGPGTAFELEYLVLLNSEPKTTSDLNDRYDRWLAGKEVKNE